MAVAPCRDRAALEAALRRDPALYTYHLGDLDDFFWPRTRWWTLAGPGGGPAEVALLYQGADPPTLLGVSRDLTGLSALLREVQRELPAQVYAHLSPGALPALGPGWRAEPHGRHLKMRLADPGPCAAIDCARAAPLDERDLEPLLALYRAAYPGNWFDPRMLATGFYRGVRAGQRLLAVAGVHVVSVPYAVAALGNITTDPAARGQGLGRTVTAAVVQALLAAGVQEIGLHVHGQNAAAIALYRRLGFVPTAEYEEYALVR